MSWMSSKTLKPIVIIGMGRMGRSLAAQLSEDGWAVVAVDLRASHLERLPAAYSGFTVEGDARELEVLQKARVPEAAWVLVLTDDDNLNLMVALIARRWFHVKRSVARIGDSARASLAAQLQIETINPNGLAVDACLTLLAEEATR